MQDSLLERAKNQSDCRIRYCTLLKIKTKGIFSDAYQKKFVLYNCSFQSFHSQTSPKLRVIKAQKTRCKRYPDHSGERHCQHDGEDLCSKQAHEQHQAGDNKATEKQTTILSVSRYT